jgi:hypothetical protein
MNWLNDLNRGVRRLIGAKPRCFLDPEATRASVAGVYKQLRKKNRVIPSEFEDSDIAFIQKDACERWRDRRESSGTRTALSQLPHVTQELIIKSGLMHAIADRPYALETFENEAAGALKGIWVEKPSASGRGHSIRFLRAPVDWRNPGHVLQRYVEDPYLLEDRKFDVRVLVKLNDRGRFRMHRDGLIRCANQPFSLESLDPLIHNSNIMFQRREGIESYVNTQLSELSIGAATLGRIEEIVADVVATSKERKRFRGSHDFELLGFDFIIHADQRVSVVEINNNPGFYFGHPETKFFYRAALRSLFG